MPTSAPPRREPASQVFEFFSREGLLSRWHPNFEYRPGQLQMARAVEAAMRERRHLIVEAGTGTGKTLAYLVPALLSGKRVVISTGTKNLQEQLFHKDIPFLQQHIERPLKVCYMKGRANYVCKAKLYDARTLPILDGLSEVSEFEEIARWEAETETGDRAELKSLPEDSRVWPKIDARSDRCSGQRCPHFDSCFITAMHRRAYESDVIIVNHHLFFADLAVKDDEFGAIIPDYSVVVFDEAHEIEDTAAQYFGNSVSTLQVLDLTRDIRSTMRTRKLDLPNLSRAVDWLDESSTRFFHHFRGPDGRVGFHGFEQRNPPHLEPYQQLITALSLVGNSMRKESEAIGDFLPLFRRAGTISDNLQAWVDSPDRDAVHWVERRGKNIALQACPIDVGPLLREKLFSRIETVILTSATLAVSGSFDFIANRVGLENPKTLMVEGGFDYQKQALLYMPPDLPDPRSDLFAERAAETIARTLAVTQGRAFLLFTSHQQMRLLYDLLAPTLPYPSLLQGDAPKSHLLKQFKETPNAVLFATSSFWQGVDVPGEQLSCVVIDKLPFAVPSDPVVSARIEKIREDGGAPFFEYQIPQAAIALKQGFGRLIRSGSDRGLLVILDNRIRGKAYGRVFLESLPPYRLTASFQEVEDFFATP
ncbi:MAG: ATP-dependent DNA helicase [Bryobacterales bacterium]|nr:ATP-dependent DNA helicase [Bryobacterales bacterium]